MAVTTVDMPAREPILKQTVQPMGLLEVSFAKAGSQGIVIVQSQFPRMRLSKEDLLQFETVNPERNARVSR